MATKFFGSASLSKSDVAAAKYALRKIPNGADRAMTRALNSIGNQARTAFVKEIRADLELSSKFLKTKIYGPAQEPRNKATFSRKVARVTAESRGLRLAHFMRSTRTNLTLIDGRLKPLIEVKVKRGGQYKVIRDGFLLRLRKGDQRGDKFGIFVRRNGRLKHLYGPSASQAMQQEMDVVGPKMDAELARVYDSKVKGLLAAL